MGKAKPVASIPFLRLWRLRLRSVFGHLGFGGGIDIVGRKARMAFLFVTLTEVQVERFTDLSSSGLT